jgi:hypothetical protein
MAHPPLLDKRPIPGIDASVRLNHQTWPTLAHGPLLSAFDFRLPTHDSPATSGKIQSSGRGVQRGVSRSKP